MKTFTFKPVYGYGWHNGENTIEVPEPFTIEGNSKGVSIIDGQIIGTHQFVGLQASLSLRTASEGIKHYNVVLRSEKTNSEVTGYVELLS